MDGGENPNPHHAFGRDEFISNGVAMQLPKVGRGLCALHRQGSEKKEGGPRRR